MKPCDTTSAGEFHPFRAELPPTPSMRSVRHWQRKSSPVQTATMCRAHHVHALLSSPQTHKQRILAPSFRDEQPQHREGQDRTQGHTAYMRRSRDLNQVCEIPKVKSDPSDGKAWSLRDGLGRWTSTPCHSPKALETPSSGKCLHWLGASSPALRPLRAGLAGFSANGKAPWSLSLRHVPSACQQPPVPTQCEIPKAKLY